LTWNVTRTGTAHGLSLWFDSCLAEGISFSNAPTEFELIYGSAFFPLTAPILVATGDTISVSLAANLVGADYVWGWNTLVLSQGMIKADFKQSTFFANILHPEQLRKISATHVPSLNDDGEVDRFILNLMDARNSLKEIALRLSERFPDRFAGSQDALTKVSELSLKYS
jgi:protein arginine N-methyltransferase 1